ncbi:MAG: penicillin-binding protein 2 [Eggerthellaceae bacterium]|nr:penicillin-binding protein 2 [Eggerthellaceae bacterium]
MLTAGIVIAITLVLCTVAALVLYSVRNKRKSTHVGGRHAVASIDTIDITASLSEAKRWGGSDIQVSGFEESAMGLVDRLRSRFMAMGVLTAAIFGTLGIRLWSMQVLLGEDYAQQARQNLYSTVSTVAPRGYIFDADGVPLVKNRTTQTVLASAEVASDRSVVQRLSVLLGIPHNVVRERIRDTSSGAQSQRIVASDVSLREIAFIAEHSTAFPGVSTQSRTVREYPWGALGAHVLGYAGVVAPEQLKNPDEGTNVMMGDITGKSGVEASYNRLLAGDHGQRVVIADVDGTVREVVSETAPTKGNDVYLTLRAPIQQVADKALAAMIAPIDGVIGTGRGVTASLVCIDVRDGGIAALSNYPTYTPESFVGGISTEEYELLNADESHHPLLNRAVAGTYPAASTFKAFTGLAGLEYGFADKERKWVCDGWWTGFGEAYGQGCWNLYGHGPLDFRTGIVVSCDVVFYEIAKGFYEARDKIGDTAMQDFIKRFGFSGPTGVDLKGEATGIIPTPAWRLEYYRDVPEEAPWRPGDLSNMSIGQGNVEVTPLQMAVGYAAVATGKRIRPHILKEVRNSEGEVVVSRGLEEEGDPLNIKEEHLALVRDALHGVAQEDWDVSKTFWAYGLTDAAAKTGTAEVGLPEEGIPDTGWFACWAPYKDPKYVVACVVEEGGAGALSACPLCAEVLSAALRYDEGTLDGKLVPIPGSTGRSLSREELRALHGGGGRGD